MLAKVLFGMSDEYSRIEGRAEDLFDEKDTRTTVELLAEHELDFGLPEIGESISSIESERQAELNAALLRVGQQFEQYFIDIAAALGYTISIEEFVPFWTSVSTVNSPVGPLRNLFFFRILIDLDSVTYPNEVNITKLISRMTAIKPGHTHILFEFEGASFSRGFSRAFNSIPHYDNSWHGGDFEGLGGPFSPDFSDAFCNNVGYDGTNFTGSFAKAFSIDFDRDSGGPFTDAFSLAFKRVL